MTSTLNDGPLPFGATWTAHTLQQLVDTAAPESQVLEFKEREYHDRDERGPVDRRPKQTEMAKDVAALANTTGGALIIGIAESDGAAAAIRPLHSRGADDEQLWMRQVLARRLTSVPTMNFQPVPWDGGGYVLVVEIPPSPAAPHGVIDPADDTRRISYPVRRGVGTDYLTEPEIASAYTARLLGQRQRDELTTQRLEQAHARTCPNGQRTTWLWVNSVPTLPRPDTLMTADVATRLRQWHQQHELDGIDHGPWIHQRPPLGQAIPGPGFISLHDIQSGHQAGAAYAELWNDGRCYTAALHDTTDDQSRWRLATAEWLVDQLLVLLDYALRFTLHQAGPLSPIAIQAGLNDLPFTKSVNDPKNLTAPYLHPPVQLGVDHRNTFVPKGGTRILTSPPRVTVSVDATQAQTNRSRAIAAYSVAASLLAHFGTTDIPFLGADGPLTTGTTPAPDSWVQRYHLADSDG